MSNGSQWGCVGGIKGNQRAQRINKNYGLEGLSDANLPN